MKRYLAKKTRQLSLVAAGVFGFGLAVGNYTIGGLCLFAAFVLDALSCFLAPTDN